MVLFGSRWQMEPTNSLGRRRNGAGARAGAGLLASVMMDDDGKYVMVGEEWEMLA